MLFNICSDPKNEGIVVSTLVRKMKIVHVSHIKCKHTPSPPLYSSSSDEGCEVRHILSGAGQTCEAACQSLGGNFFCDGVGDIGSSEECMSNPRIDRYVGTSTFVGGRVNAEECTGSESRPKWLWVNFGWWRECLGQYSRASKQCGTVHRSGVHTCCKCKTRTQTCIERDRGYCTTFSDDNCRLLFALFCSFCF